MDDGRLEGIRAAARQWWDICDPPQPTSAEPMAGAASYWWEPTRQRVLADLDQRVVALIQDVSCTVPVAQRVDAIKSLERRRLHVLGPDWLPDRPGRRMPTLWVIASYWAERGTFGRLLDWAHCFRCWAEPPDVDEDARPEDRWLSASGFLERAHLVDRWKGGLDGPQNIVPLCRRCHRAMPMFRAGAGSEAIAWVRTNPQRNSSVA